MKSTSVDIASPSETLVSLAYISAEKNALSLWGTNTLALAGPLLLLVYKVDSYS